MLAVAFSIGACTGSPGTAVESMGESYSERDVTVATDELAPVLQMAGGTGRQTIVNLLAQVQPVLQAAKDYDLAGPDDIDMAVGLLPDSNPDDLGRATRDILLMAFYANLTQGEIYQVVNPEDFSPPETVINPRYGEINPETGQLNLPALGDVVTPTGQQ